MNTVDYERLKEAAELEHRLNMEAIDRVRRMEQSLAGSSIPTSANGKLDDHASAVASPKRKRRSSAEGGKVVGVLREAISFQDGEFTRQTLLDQLKLNHPGKTIKDGSLKAALKRLTDSGEIEVVVKAQGRRHATYKRGQKKVKE